MLRRNVVANLAGRAVALSLQLLLIPVFLHLLGVEAVGLIGFYNTMLAATGVVEFSIGTTIVREIAKLQETGHGAQLQRDLLRTTEVLYVACALAIGTATSFAAPAIVHTWLSRSTLGEQTLILCVVLMGWTVALQLFFSLYLNALNGLERQWRSNVLSILLACLRGFGALAVLLVVSATAEAYFATQLLVVVFVLATSSVTVWRSLPSGTRAASLNFDLLLSTWHYTRSLTGTAILFLLLSQADKFIASAVVPLEQFGYYVIASMFPGLMWAIYGSVAIPLTPRFTRMLALGEDRQVRDLFHGATQFMGLILLPPAVIAIFHAEALVLLWTGNHLIAVQTAPLLALLTIGTLLACLACASNTLQLASGLPELNLLNNIVWIVGLPITWFATLKYGAQGATVMWLVGGVISLAVAPTLFHRRMLRGEQTRWYLRDMAIPAGAAAIVGGLSASLTSVASSRLLIGLQLLLVWMVTSFIVLLVCPALRVAASGMARRSLALIRP